VTLTFVGYIICIKNTNFLSISLCSFEGSKVKSFDGFLLLSKIKVEVIFCKTGVVLLQNLEKKTKYIFCGTSAFFTGKPYYGIFQKIITLIHLKNIIIIGVQN
jgi:hypothetical protein